MQPEYTLSAFTVNALRIRVTENVKTGYVSYDIYVTWGTVWKGNPKL